MLAGLRFAERINGEKMEINLLDILKIGNPEDYKLHLGCMNDEGNHPLDLFIEDEQQWKGWNEWRGNKNDWTRDYIFSLIEFYPKSKGKGKLVLSLLTILIYRTTLKEVPM